MKGRHKYGAKKVHRYGLTFDSNAEADRYGYLIGVRLTGEILHFARQVRIPLHGVDGVKLTDFIPDFLYEVAGRGWFIEDVKGYLNTKDPIFRLYKLKAGLAAAQYGIPVLTILKKDVKTTPAGGTDPTLMGGDRPDLRLPEAA